ncbi:hypothetical protein [Singulisphaera acidiphila]|uniref:hypothetical protein n=1 Tax=Singulisphaera acidiphila TaxID=466153 RepID=UPI00157775F6|nr:hypothetical protein [Singulisphaera acidiphila]
MERHRHVVLAGSRERIADELARLVVGHIEAERPDGEAQLVALVPGRPNRLVHVAHKRVQL